MITALAQIAEVICSGLKLTEWMLLTSSKRNILSPLLGANQLVVIRLHSSSGFFVDERELDGDLGNLLHSQIDSL